MTMLNSLLRKIYLWIILIISLSLIIVISLLVYGFLNLANYMPYIQRLVLKYSAAQLSYSKLNTSFNNAYQPQLTIDNLSLKQLNSSMPWLKIKQLKLALSYTSLWQQQLIFSDIQLNGTTLKFEYDKNNNLYLNQYLLTNLNSNKSSSTSNWQELFLAQQQLTLSNINLSIIDNKHKLLPLNINNLNFNMRNTPPKEHHFRLNFALTHSKLVSELNFRGQSISDLNTWQQGTFSLHSVGTQGYLIDVNAKVNDGSLQWLTTSLNSNQQQINTYTPDFNQLSAFNGKIELKQISRLQYSLQANDLMLNTVYGPLFEHASIDGRFSLAAGGYLKVKNIKLSGINNLIRLMQISHKLKFAGEISNISLNWEGNFIQPHHLRFYTNLNDFALTSSESNLPSFNNLNAKLFASESHATLTLSLAKSKLNYPKYLLHEWFIQQLNSQINWQLNPKKQTTFSWQIKKLQTPAFDLTSTGSYLPSESNLNANIQIKSLALNGIADLLPTAATKDTYDYLKPALQAGNINNAQITFTGNPQLFPFKQGGGDFKIQANLDAARYQFYPGWGALDKLSGKILGHNQEISILLTGGNLSTTTLKQAKIQVPDINANQAQLLAIGTFNGQSTDFLDYLASSPITAPIVKFNQFATSSGNGIANFNLNLPLSDPARFKLSGFYQAFNNQLTLKSKLLTINNINGQLKFNQNGLTPSTINATALNSNLIFKVIKPNLLQLNSPNLNYTQLAKMFYPPLESVIIGSAPSTINYNLSTQELEAHSTLNNLQINAPEPLAKTESTNREITLLANFAQIKPQFKLNYANLIYAQAVFESQWDLNYLTLALGTHNYLPSTKQHKITLNLQFTQLYLEQWDTFLKQFTNHNSISNESSGTIFPVLAKIKAQSFWLNNYNLDAGTANVSLQESMITANIDTPNIAGMLNYYPESSALDLNLERLNLAQSNYHPLQTKTTSINNELPSKLPTMHILIKNLYLQNSYWGELRGRIYPQDNAIYFENFSLKNQAATSTFNLINQNIGANESIQYVALNLHSDIHNFGIIASRLNQGNIFKNGNGSFDLSATWPGSLADFNLDKLIAQVNLNINDGRLEQINPGIFGTLLGVINLSAINPTNINHFNFNSFFGKGFAFKTFNTQATLENNNLTIQQLDLLGDIARITSFGNYYPESNTINSYLTVEPRLGGTVATAAGIITLNPIIGGFVYLGQMLIGEPINKALAISYHLEGNAESPNMTQTKISTQIMQNFKSSLDFVPLPNTTK